MTSLIHRTTSRCFLLALLSGAAFVSAAPAQSAKNADPEIYFYPAGGWKIEKNAQTCAISSQFNNGFLIRFDGSAQNWVEKFSVNFRQDIFKPGQPYNVTLALPGNKPQTIEAQAMNPQSLAMDFKGRKDFFKALSASSVLDMGIEQNRFRFYMTGFSGQSAEFERCMAGGEPAEKTAKAPPPDIAVQNVQEQEKSQEEFIVNEAIAMEESVKKASGQLPELNPEQPITEISPENPQPIAQPIAVQETKRVGDKIIEQTRAPEDQLAAADMSAPPLPVPPPPEQKPAPEPILKDLPVAAAAPAPEVIKAPAPAPAAPPPQAPAKAAIIAGGAPGLVNKNSISPQALAALLAQQMNSDPSVVSSALEEPQAPVQESPPEEEHIPLTDAMAEPPAAELAPEQPVIQPIEQAKATAPEAQRPSPPAAPQPAAAVEPPQEIAPAQDEHAAASDMVLQKVSSPEMKVRRETIETQADFTAVGESAPSAGSVTDQVMLDKIRELEGLVDKLKSENIALNQEVHETVNASKEEKHTISSQNWNLEQATTRYMESERQLKKLGQELQMERAKCTADKKDLEASLFDPQITDQEQLARLTDLEQQLSKAREDLDLQRMRYEEQIKVLQGRATP